MRLGDIDCRWIIADCRWSTVNQHLPPGSPPHLVTPSSCHLVTRSPDKTATVEKTMAPISWHSVDQSLDECIKCNICTSYCPVSAVTDLFPGPKYVGPQAQRFREHDQAHVARSLGRLLFGLPRLQRGLPDRREDRRAECPRPCRRSWRDQRACRCAIACWGATNCWASWAASPRRWPTSGCTTPSAASWRRRSWASPARRRCPRGARPAPSATGSNARPGNGCRSDKKVVYYHGCATMYYEPFIGKAAVAVLEHNGYEVIVPEQNCCGLPLL